MLGRLTVFLLVALLIWGNLVSGLGAGLACPDWPLCYGQYLPPLRWDIVLEKGHRVLAAITGIALIALSATRAYRYKGFTKGIPLVTVILFGIQIPLGGLVVLLRLPVNVTTLHFAIAMLLFSLALYMAYHDGRDIEPAFSMSAPSALFLTFGILVLVQSVLGAYVRHSHSGLACGVDFPKCLGYWVPANLAGSVLIHFAHRTVAYTLLLMGLGGAILAFYSSSLAPYRTRLLVVLALIFLQVAVGVGVIHTRMGGLTVAFHLLIAIMIFFILATTWFRDMRARGV